VHRPTFQNFPRRLSQTRAAAIILGDLKRAARIYVGSKGRVDRIATIGAEPWCS